MFLIWNFAQIDQYMFGIIQYCYVARLEQETFFLLWADPGCSSVVPGAFLPDVMWPVHEDHLPLCGFNVNDVRNCTVTPRYVFVEGCLFKRKEN